MRLETSALARRHALALVAAALSGGGPFLRPPGAYAEYGQGAGVALPALLPSPIRPTGPMADTCEVVALGREDVCLEFKKIKRLSALKSLEKRALCE